MGRNASSEDVVVGSPAVAKTVRAYLESLRARKFAAKTVTGRRNALNGFLRFLEEKDIDQFRDVTVEVFENYRLALVERGLRVNTIESYLTSVRLLYDWLEANAVVFENPTRHRPVRRVPPPLPEVLTVEEINRLLNVPDCSTALGMRDRAILEVLYSTAVRRAEAMRLAVTDVHLKERVLHVFGKGSKDRFVPFGKHTAAALDNYLGQARPKLVAQSAPPCDALWLGYHHKPIGGETLIRLVAEHGRKAGFEKPISPHILRRSCVTHMLGNGASPLAIARMLGHADLESLSHYLRVTIADLKKMHSQSKPGR